MRLASLIIAAFLILMSHTHAQRAWDVDKDVPPPTDISKPLPKPTKLKPFTFIFYEVCDSPDTPALTTSKWWFEIMSKYTMVSFDHHESDSDVVLTLRTSGGFGPVDKIWFPQTPFNLRVVLRDDTAVFKMDLIAGTCVYEDTSSLITVEEPKVLPADLVRMQFRSRDNARAREFLRLAAAQFGAAVEPFLLAKGFYPCLPTQVVERTNVGRGKVVNETAWGFLVCLRVVETTRAAEVAQWVSERQREESARAGKR